MSLLRVRGLDKAFGGVAAVSGLNFDVAEGEVVAMIGPNGAGKTTCFNMLSGQLRPDGGSIVFGGRELAGMAPRRIWRLGVGRTFQITATFASMTVRENVQMALLSHHRCLGGLFTRAARFYSAEAEALLGQVGMTEQAERPCAVLAHGDLKRLELAMALANHPRLLLLDEPTAGVAAGERGALMALVNRIVVQHGISVLFTEHDMDVVFGNARRIIALHRGELVAEGSPKAVRDDARVREVYLSWDGEPETREGDEC